MSKVDKLLSYLSDKISRHILWCDFSQKYIRGRIADYRMVLRERFFGSLDEDWFEKEDWFQDELAEAIEEVLQESKAPRLLKTKKEIRDWLYSLIDDEED